MLHIQMDTPVPPLCHKQERKRHASSRWKRALECKSQEMGRNAPSKMARMETERRAGAWLAGANAWGGGDEDA